MLKSWGKNLKYARVIFREKRGKHTRSRHIRGRRNIRSKNLDDVTTIFFFGWRFDCLEAKQKPFLTSLSRNRWKLPCWILLDFDLLLVYLIMQSYLATREWDEVDWLDPLIFFSLILFYGQYPTWVKFVLFSIFTWPS